MLINRYLFALYILLIASVVKAQEPVTLIGGSAEGYVGEVVCVPVLVEDFQDIIAYEFAIAYDSTVVRVVDIDETMTDIDTMGLDLVTASPAGKSFVSAVGVARRFDNNGLEIPVSIPDGTMFVICFELIGEPGDMSVLAPGFSNQNRASFTTLDAEGNKLDLEVEVEIGKITILPDDDEVAIMTNVCDDVVGTPESEGSISFMATPGLNTTGPYSYQILDSGGVELAGGAGLTGSIDNLPIGDYTIVITDSSNPQKTSTKVVLIEQDPVIEAVLNVVNPSCAGRNSGRIEIESIPGGIENYTIKWESPEHNLVKYHEQTLRSLYAGEYLLTMEDSKGCIYQQTIDIVEPEPISLSDISITRACHDSDAIIQATINGGTLTPGNEYRINYTYNENINGGGNLDLTINRTIEDRLVMGNLVLINSVSLEITDSRGCPFDTTLILPRPEEVVLDTSSIRSCTGNQATAIASGGVGGYIYHWTHDVNETSGVANNVGMTTTVYAEDANGCFSDQITFNFPDGGDVSVNFNITENRVTCNGGSDGEAIINVDNSSEWELKWYTDPTYTTEITELAGNFNPTGLEAGTYYVQATFQNTSCIIEDVVVINEPDIIEAEFLEIMDVACFGDNDGSIRITATGGNNSAVPVYTYTLNGNSMTGETVTFPGLTNGEFTITIADENNCTLDTTFIIDSPAALLLDIDETRTFLKSCNRDFGQFAVTASGGTGTNYQYVWTKDNQNYATTSENIIENLDAGVYKVSVRDENGCRTELDSLLTIRDVQAITFDVEYTEPECYGDKSCINATSVAGGSGSDYKLQIDFGLQQPLGGDCIEVFAGQHTVVVIDGDGCVSEEENIFIEQPSEILLDAGEDRKIRLGETTDPISLTIQNEFAIDSILWTPDEALEYLTTDRQIAQASPSDDVIYTIEVVDENGCRALDDVLVEVNKSRRVAMANIFSPNGDGQNDYFSISVPSAVKELNEFLIFDRWGTLLFEDSNVDLSTGSYQGWDGRANGNYVQPGVYVWQARFTFIDGYEAMRTGSITIVR